MVDSIVDLRGHSKEEEGDLLVNGQRIGRVLIS